MGKLPQSVPTPDQTSSKKEINGDATLKALYYPWAAIQRRDTLKKSLVYFDSVQLLYDSRVIPRTKGELNALSDLETFVVETGCLQENGVLELISPSEVMFPDDARSIIYASVADDLNDPEIKNFEPPFSIFGNDKFLIDIGDGGSMAMLNYFLVDFYAAHLNIYSDGSQAGGYMPTNYMHKLVHFPKETFSKRL